MIQQQQYNTNGEIDSRTPQAQWRTTNLLVKSTDDIANCSVGLRILAWQVTEVQDRTHEVS